MMVQTQIQFNAVENAAKLLENVRMPIISLSERASDLDEEG